MSTRLVLIASIIFVAQGCVFTPQAVKVMPKIDVSPTMSGGGHPVTVKVVDERPRRTLGTRGASGYGADLTIEGDLVSIIRDAVVEGMQQHNFKPLTGSNPEGRELRVEIRNLDYDVTDEFWAYKIRVVYGLKAICIRDTSRPYEQHYHGEHVSRALMTKSAEQNNTYVSDAVSVAVNSLLRDEKLRSCLAK